MNVHECETDPDAKRDEPFSNSLDHLLAELERIDLLIQTRVRQARLLTGAHPEFQGLCIGETEVEALLAKPGGLPLWADPASGLGAENLLSSLARLKSSIDHRKNATIARGIRLRLEELAVLFNLAPQEMDIILVCLASEMDSRYEKLYAYLQDDVTKKRPSVDLVLNLLCGTFQEKIQARSRFDGESPLVRQQLLHLFVDPSQPEPTLLRRYCRLDDRMVSFLLGVDAVAETIRSSVTLTKPAANWDAVMLSSEIQERLLAVCPSVKSGTRDATFYFQGTSGSGRRSAAAAFCGAVGCPLLVVDVKQILGNSDADFSAASQLVMREAILQRAAIYWQRFHLLLTDEKAAALSNFLERLTEKVKLNFLAGESAWAPSADQLHGGAFIAIPFTSPTEAQRHVLWERFLPIAQRAANLDLAAFSTRFSLLPDRIQAAAETAVHLARWRDPASGLVGMNELFTACRLHSNRKLASLARKIEPKYTLDDIILPPDQLSQLNEILNQARHRHTVLGSWGFERKLSLGKGLNVLFSGPPGTGKTMAAEVIASELRLDLYKIDLSQIVSKYIGETEKNLDQIFREAHGSNAILFFDEADALFGKRSEVKDAHDRYANIEVGYLLQKMEEYEGVAILATNIRQNLDEAFVRRMHVILEFPVPDEEHRRRLWQVAFPREAPIGEDVDFAVLARDVRLAGGNIKNIALTAAFYAAGDGKVIHMPHLGQAAHREHQKLGRAWNESWWKPPAKHLS